MASITGTVTPSSMIIHANVTNQKSMAARTGINVAAIQIVRRDLQAHRGRLDREVRQVLKVFPELEVRWALKARKA